MGDELKLRTVLGRPLQDAEVDGNFLYINEKANTSAQDSSKALGISISRALVSDYPYRLPGQQDGERVTVDRQGWILSALAGNGASLTPIGPATLSSWHEYPYRSATRRTDTYKIDRAGYVVAELPAIPPVPVVTIPAAGEMYVSVDGATKEVSLVWAFSDTQLARLLFQPNGFNGLFNWKSYDQAPMQNPAGEISWTTIVTSDSDMFPPLMLSAVANGDGGAAIYTGGNHGSNGSAGGEKTAQSVSVDLWVDGARLLPGMAFKGYADRVRARWVNDIMGFNTISVGRYIARQTFDTVFYAGGLYFIGQVKALEAFDIRTDNGIQLFQSGFSTCHYFGGIDQGRTAIADAQSSGLKGDYPAWAMIFGGENGIHGCWYDRTYGAGDGRYIRGTAGYFRNGNNGKSYSAIVAGGGAPYPRLEAGEFYEYHGGIIWARDNANGVLDCAFPIFRRSKLALAMALTGAGAAAVDVPAIMKQHDIADLGFAGIEPISVSATGYSTSINLVE